MVKSCEEHALHFPAPERETHSRQKAVVWIARGLPLSGRLADGYEKW